MTQAHTPGPWTILNRGYKSHITDADMNWNAEIVGPGHTANAHLIAAAPDLLAALEEIESLPVDDYGCREIPPGFLDKARAAIAKAKGASDAD